MGIVSQALPFPNETSYLSESEVKREVGLNSPNETSYLDKKR